MWKWLLSGSSRIGQEAFRGLKKFSGDGWWLVEKVIMVSVHVLYIGFTHVLLLFMLDWMGCQVHQYSMHQFMSVYVGWQGHGA